MSTVKRKIFLAFSSKHKDQLLGLNYVDPTYPDKDVFTTEFFRLTADDSLFEYRFNLVECSFQKYHPGSNPDGRGLVFVVEKEGLHSVTTDSGKQDDRPVIMVWIVLNRPKFLPQPDQPNHTSFRHSALCARRHAIGHEIIYAAQHVEHENDFLIINDSGEIHSNPLKMDEIIVAPQKHDDYDLQCSYRTLHRDLRNFLDQIGSDDSPESWILNDEDWRWTNFCENWDKQIVIRTAVNERSQAFVETGLWELWEGILQESFKACGDQHGEIECAVDCGACPNCHKIEVLTQQFINFYKQKELSDSNEHLVGIDSHLISYYCESKSS